MGLGGWTCWGRHRRNDSRFDPETERKILDIVTSKREIKASISWMPESFRIWIWWWFIYLNPNSFMPNRTAVIGILYIEHWGNIYEYHESRSLQMQWLIKNRELKSSVDLTHIERWAIRACCRHQFEDYGPCMCWKCF